MASFKWATLCVAALLSLPTVRGAPCSPIGGWVKGTANYEAYTVAARGGDSFMARCDVGGGS